MLLQLQHLHHSSYTDVSGKGQEESKSQKTRNIPEYHCAAASPRKGGISRMGTMAISVDILMWKGNVTSSHPSMKVYKLLRTTERGTTSLAQ